MTNKDAQPTLNLLLVFLHLGIIKESTHNLAFSILIHQIHIQEHIDAMTPKLLIPRSNPRKR